MTSELGKSSAVVLDDCRREPDEDPGRARLAVRASRLLVVVFGACWLSGCGGHPASVATAEQTALALLRNSAISRRVVALSYQADEAPTTCLIQPEEGKSGRFELFVTWKPSTAVGAQLPQSVLLASVSDKSPSDDSYEVATYRNRFGSPVPIAPSVVAGLARASLSQTASQCEVLDDGRLELATSGGS
jgi:hypothetical protein